MVDQLIILSMRSSLSTSNSSSLSFDHIPRLASFILFFLIFFSHLKLLISSDAVQPQTPPHHLKDQGASCPILGPFEGLERDGSDLNGTMRSTLKNGTTKQKNKRFFFFFFAPHATKTQPQRTKPFCQAHTDRPAALVPS